MILTIVSFIIFNSHGDEDVEQEEGYVECRRYYVTVTTLPSLHNCRDCRLVAASFDEEGNSTVLVYKTVIIFKLGLI